MEARGRWKLAGPSDSWSVRVRCTGNAKDGNNPIYAFGSGESDQRRGQRTAIRYHSAVKLKFSRASYHVYGGQRPQAQGSLRNVGIKAINMRLVHVRNH